MDLQVSIRRGIEHATRLRFLSGVAWSSPELLFERVGLVTGMNCLDVRCAPPGRGDPDTGKVGRSQRKGRGN